jgi:hypothetical protein
LLRANTLAYFGDENQTVYNGDKQVFESDVSPVVELENGGNLSGKRDER